MSCKSCCSLFRQSKLARYSFAVLTAVAAVSIRILIDPWVGNRVPFTPLILFMILVCLTCGIGPGLVTLLLGFIAMQYLFVQPRHTFGLQSPGDIAETITFLLVTLGTLWLINRQRNTQHRAIEGECLARNRLLELETLYQQAPIGLCFIDLQHRLLRINEHLAAIDGQPAEAHIGRSLWEMVPELEPVLRPILERVIATGQPVDNFELVGRTRRCVHERWWLVSYHSVRDRDGRILGVNGTVLDITDRKQAEHHLHQLNNHLEQRVRERTAELESFTNSVAHDLRAPIRSIASFTQLAMEDSGPQLNPHGREHLQTVIRAAERMDRLILDLLTLSNISQHKLRQKAVNLSDLAESIVANIRHENPRRATRTRFDITPGLTVHGDERFLRIALENLLDNAWKFTGTHAHGHIQFGAEQRDGETVYYVRDDGIGFDMAHAGRIFGIFERLHAPEEFPGTATVTATRNGNGNGTGIGLALVQRIIARHEGRIWAASTPGHGATFYFTLGQGQGLPAKSANRRERTRRTQRETRIEEGG